MRTRLDTFAVVIDNYGDILYPECDLDDADLWDILWSYRDEVLGVAHTHFVWGESAPSSIELTTFAAVESGLARRLRWWIVTKDTVVEWAWLGCERHDYAVDETCLSPYSSIWHPTSFVEVYLDRNRPLYPDWVFELQARCRAHD